MEHMNFELEEYIWVHSFEVGLFELVVLLIALVETVDLLVDSPLVIDIVVFELVVGLVAGTVTGM